MRTIAQVDHRVHQRVDNGFHPPVVPAGPRPADHRGMTNENAITVRGLRKQYRDLNAVDGIDLDIAYGEIFALLGPNGAGKTTTVEILEGHRPRTAGDVRVLGEDPGRAGRTWRAQLGMVLQDATDAGELRVGEVLAHFARYYAQPRRPAEVLELVGLTEHRRRRVRVLSGGQRRRLDVAVGIIGRPRLLFLDEPTTGFDPQARRQFWELIRSLSTDGTTILLTTHYMEEAEALAHRVAVIAGGRLVADGTPATLGGRARALTSVSWLDGGHPRQVSTDEPGVVITELTARYGGDVPGLTVSRPTLEDIYLDLIGQKS
jgi:ABC-2 type transport system ATP-binding protein